MLLKVNTTQFRVRIRHTNIDNEVKFTSVSLGSWSVADLVEILLYAYPTCVSGINNLPFHSLL